MKIDGLPFDLLDRYVTERNPQTGKSTLPWIEYVFYQKGTRLANFYTRGMSLSGPSWSVLDTGQHLQIKGNVEFDRYTLHSYDYLNFIPFWIGNIGRVRVDMPGTELMDELGTPLVLDSYPYDERHLSFQLFQRGLRWTTLERGLKNYFLKKGPRELFDEWHVGIGGRSILMEQLERELISKLDDPKIRYLDFYTTDFDHATHHNRDRATHLAALKDIDSLVGRVWSAIQKTPQAEETALVLVSDHGTNTNERIYSQGYNLVKLLGTPKGGGHHVVTKRRLMKDYALKGIYPLVPLIYTTTDDSYYLRGESTSYPTAIIDFDGNERASIHLRDSDLNLLHILLLELKRKNLSHELRKALTSAFFDTLNRRRPAWQRTLDEMTAELGALKRLIAQQQKIVDSQPKKWTAEDRAAGRDQAALRAVARLDSWSSDERKLSAFLVLLSNRLALRQDSFDPYLVKIEDVIPKNSMGDSNSVHSLQNYIVGLGERGFVMKTDGSLDIESSFRTVNYFDLLSETTVRNNVQPGVANRPVDFVAVRLDVDGLRMKWNDGVEPEEAFWLHGPSGHEALVLAKKDERQRLALRYLPISNLRQNISGEIHFDRAPWAEGYPLHLWEDPFLVVPMGTDRKAWLEAWHTDVEWLRATHLTRYSNAVVGLHEQLAQHLTEATDASLSGVDTDQRLIRRFRYRQRQLVENDLLVLANNHWNFDVRGFNPGGNHGSFFRPSTHATLMLAGGARTKIPQNFVINEPYDTLSFVPTFFTLSGKLSLPSDSSSVRVSWQGNQSGYPGRLIQELFTPTDFRSGSVDILTTEGSP